MRYVGPMCGRRLKPPNPGPTLVVHTFFEGGQRIGSLPVRSWSPRFRASTVVEGRDRAVSDSDPACSREPGLMLGLMTSSVIRRAVRMRLARARGSEVDGRAPGCCCSLSHWAQKCSCKGNRKWCFLLETWAAGDTAESRWLASALQAAWSILRIWVMELLYG